MPDGEDICRVRTKENTLARLRHIRRKSLALLVMRSLENIFSTSRRFTLLDGSHKWQMPIFFLRIFFTNKVLCGKTKAHYFVFPDFLSPFLSEILVISTHVGQFCQSLDICLALQRTCLVELFVLVSTVTLPWS